MFNDVLDAILRPPFRAAARLMHRPTFHPRGVLLTGTFRAAEPFRDRTGGQTQAVTARMSKGVGTPGSLPDILGLSFEIHDADGRPWDFVLGSVGTRSITRYLFAVPRSWARARFSSLMHYQFDDDESFQVWALPKRGFPASTSLADLRQAARAKELVIDVTTSPDDSAPTIGTLELRLAADDREVPRWFDPVVHRPPNVKLLPTAIAQAREEAYAASRAGRELER